MGYVKEKYKIILVVIKLINILKEINDPNYYDFQIVINPGESMGTIFIHKDGRTQKHTVSRDDNPLVLDYRNIPGIIKAAYKAKNDKTEIVIWDETGKGKTYPFTIEAIEKIKK